MNLKYVHIPFNVLLFLGNQQLLPVETHENRRGVEEDYFRPRADGAGCLILIYFSQVVTIFLGTCR